MILDQVLSSSRWDGYQTYPAWIQARLTYGSIAGSEGASVWRHMFGVFNNSRKRKASNEVSEDLSREWQFKLYFAIISISHVINSVFYKWCV